MASSGEYSVLRCVDNVLSYLPLVWVLHELLMHVLGDGKCLCNFLANSSLVVLCDNVLLRGSSVIANIV